jgi:hypothetical protein
MLGKVDSLNKFIVLQNMAELVKELFGIANAGPSL